MLRGKFPFARAAALALLVALAGCETDDEEYVERPVEELYNSAMDALEAEEYKKATDLFDEVERQHPYSSWATQAQLMAAYSYYMSNQYDDAVLALDRYIQLHPSSEKAPYAYYLKGLSYYEQISDVGRDQQMTELAANTFRDLIRRFPDSQYTRDAKLKIDLTYDHLAGKHMNIGRYYQSQNHCLAAINRFKLVAEKFQTTTHAPEALHRLVECYRALGMDPEAKKAAAILGHNFPGSEWYIDSYEIVKGVRIRPEEETWYDGWIGSGEKAPPPGSEPLVPPGKKAGEEEDTWYKFW